MPYLPKEEPVENTPNKVYLGDGVYAKRDQCGGIVLTTENGVETTNTIYLEPDVMKSLIQYTRGKGKE